MELRKILKTSGLVASSALFFACGLHDDVWPSQAIISDISPTSGISPLEVHAQYRCEDNPGIRNYKITKGDEVIYSGKNPIDAFITFTETGTLELSCTNEWDKTTRYGRNIRVTEPPVESLPSEL